MTLMVTNDMSTILYVQVVVPVVGQVLLHALVRLFLGCRIVLVLTMVHHVRGQELPPTSLVLSFLRRPKIAKETHAQQFLLTDNKYLFNNSGANSPSF